MDRRIIIEEASVWGINLQEEQAHLFYLYYHLLRAENRKYNLTRLLNAEQVLQGHFMDALAGLVRGSGYRGPDLLDLGTGAGFPGVPIKICLPHLRLTLLDAAKKKILFLKHLIKELKLNDIVLIRERAENYGKLYQEKYSWITTRAFAPLVVALELALPLLKIGGYFWAFKGPAADTELDVCGRILQDCGGALVDRLSYSLGRGWKDRSILIFKKIKPAAHFFPRRPGLPQKRPWQ